MSICGRSFFSNAFFALVCSGVAGFFAYLVRRLTANGLSGNEYAFFYSIFSLIGIGTAIISWGIPNAAFFCLPDYRNRGLENEAHEVYAFSLRWILITGMVLSLVIFPLILRLGNNIGRYGIPDEDIFYFLLFLPLPLYLADAMIQILNGLKQFYLSNSLLILNIATVLIGTFLFQKQFGLRAISVSYAAAALCIAGIGLWVCRKKYGYSLNRRTSSEVRRRMLKSGGWLFLSSMGYYCFAELGNVVLSYVGTPEETMKFNIAMPIAIIVRSLAVVSGIFAPYSNELFHRREYKTLRHVVLIVLVITLLMSGCAWLLLSFFGKDLLIFLFGQRFVSAESCMLLLIISVFFWNAARFITDMLNSMHHENFSAALSLGTTILAASLYFLLCPNLGADGAAWGTLIASCIWMTTSAGLMMFFLTGDIAKKQQKIVVFMAGSSIGDTIISFPALTAIRRHYANAEIAIFSYSRYRGLETLKELIHNCGLADQVIGFQPGNSLLRNVMLCMKCFWEMRCAGYDVAISIGRTAAEKYTQKIRRWRFWCRCCGIPVLQGDKNLFILPPKKKNIPLPTVPHHLTLIAERLKADGIICSLDKIDLMLNQDELAKADKIWSRLNIPSGSIPVAVGIGGKKLRWSPERFAESIRQLRSEYEIIPVFFGGSENIAEINQLTGLCGGVNAALLDLNLRENIALLRRCSFYLGNDTGTLHMAVAAGLRCIGIYSAHNYPGLWHPWGEGHIVLRKDLPCNGCMNHPCNQQRCLSEISVREVVEAAKTIIETGRHK